MKSKLKLKTRRVKIDLTESIDILTKIFLKLGCSKEVSQEVSTHLSDANLCGMESHGIMRVLQYVKQFQSGYMNPKAKSKVFFDKKGIKRVSGNGGIGIPVMKICSSFIIFWSLFFKKKIFSNSYNEVLINLLFKQRLCNTFEYNG